MRAWNIGKGDPQCLTLAADARISPVDYSNDQIWELSLTGGVPPALALNTSFGLRARSMKVFPVLIHKNKSYQNPNEFFKLPRLKAFYPNYLCVNFSPLNGIDVTAEYWCCNSNTVAGKLKFKNQHAKTESFRLEWIGLLYPLGEGRGLEHMRKENNWYLAGKTSNLEIICALNCLAVPGKGALPSLAVDIELAPGASRNITWTLCGASTPAAAMRQVNTSLTANWDAETSRIERTHERDGIEIITGNPAWDQALAFSQKTAFGLLMPASQHLPHPSFVLTRQPDRGYSALGGSDYAQQWAGQTPLDAYYLNSILAPGGSAFSTGFVENFLAVQESNGFIDLQPGLAGQRTRLLAQPLLAALAFQAAGYDARSEWLQKIFPDLLRFANSWFDAAQDHDQDGFPEWAHPVQTGLEDAPIYNPWHEGPDQGVDISILESPGLAAMLFNELECLEKIAIESNAVEEVNELQERLNNLKGALENLWNNSSSIYQYRDIEAHQPVKPATIVKLDKAGIFKIRKAYKAPQRLLVRFSFADVTATHPLMVVIHGENLQGEVEERLDSGQFYWSGRQAHTTTRNLFTRIHAVEVSGINSQTKGVVTTVDYQQSDISLLLPLWAGVPTQAQADALIRTYLAGQTLSPYGIPVSLDSAVNTAVSMPWNHLIGEGLLRYGHQKEAAVLVTNLMNAVSRSLGENCEFRDFYDSQDGKGLGEKNTLHGLAPTGLFLAVLGVKWIRPDAVIINGTNPFPWPVTVKFQGKEITRRANETIIKSPNGQIVSISGAETRQITFP